MGVKLAFLMLWTPKWVIRKELDKVAAATTSVLVDLLNANAPGVPFKISYEGDVTRTLEAKRAAMAKDHATLVAALAEAVGRDNSMKLGRAALFEVGRKLGTETRGRLGVQGSGDLVKAAKVMYRVLGIDVKVTWLAQKSATLTVKRCALAEQYSELTCMVLSATDEGVMTGLCPSATMKFQDKMTGGCSTCTADIKLD
jgi:hypothetical protein